MNKAHYIVFHPDRQRDEIAAQAIVLVNGKLTTNWTGKIWVDKIGKGNEDPFVFNDHWLYSYCHASQLRQNFRNDSYLQVGSKIFFASGQQADKGILTVDTIFIVGDVQQWTKKPILQLPTKYQIHFQNSKSPLWKRHFRFPFNGIHDSVSHTYEAELWQENKNDFSFLPLNNNGERVSIPLENFPDNLLDKIADNIKGKYPVLLSDSEMQTIFTHIDKAATIKVLKNITTNIPIAISKTIKC
jgi:hypothetical protein